MEGEYISAGKILFQAAFEGRIKETGSHRMALARLYDWLVEMFGVVPGSAS
jgi:hypothetical protein